MSRTYYQEKLCTKDVFVQIGIHANKFDVYEFINFLKILISSVNTCNNVIQIKGAMCGFKICLRTIIAKFS